MYTRVQHNTVTLSSYQQSQKLSLLNIDLDELSERYPCILYVHIKEVCIYTQKNLQEHTHTHTHTHVGVSILMNLLDQIVLHFLFLRFL